MAWRRPGDKRFFCTNDGWITGAYMRHSASMCYTGYAQHISDRTLYHTLDHVFVEFYKLFLYKAHLTRHADEYS